MEFGVRSKKTRKLLFDDAKPVNLSDLLCNLKRVKQEKNRNDFNQILKNEENFYNFVENFSNDSNIDDYHTLVLKLQNEFVRKKKTAFIINPIVDRCIILYFQYSIIYTLNCFLNTNRKNVYQDILVMVITLGLFNHIENETNVVFHIYALLIAFVIVKGLTNLAEK